MRSRLATRVTLVAAGVVVFALGLGPPLAGQDHKMEAPRLPLNPDFRNYYEKNAEEIRRLQEGARKTTRTEEDRLADFRKLRAKYPDPALHTAAELVGDPSEKIATFAVTLLGAAATMSDHRMPDAAHRTPQDMYMMQRHEAARAALRKAQADKRQAVRDRATQTLASLSDEVGLQNIVVGAREGRYSELDAVNHLGLARPAVGLRLVRPYLASEAPDVQAAAIRFLASSPNYRKEVRDQFLLNPKAALEARLAAARQLAQDPEIALLILGNAQTPPELFQETFLVYLRSGETRYSAPQLESFRAILETYLKNNQNANLKELQTQLQALQQANNP